MSPRSEREVAHPFCLERARRRPNPPWGVAPVPFAFRVGGSSCMSAVMYPLETLETSPLICNYLPLDNSSSPWGIIWLWRHAPDLQHHCSFCGGRAPHRRAAACCCMWCLTVLDGWQTTDITHACRNELRSEQRTHTRAACSFTQDSPVFVYGSVLHISWISSDEISHFQFTKSLSCVPSHSRLTSYCGRHVPRRWAAQPCSSGRPSSWTCWRRSGCRCVPAGPRERFAAPSPRPPAGPGRGRCPLRRLSEEGRRASFGEPSGIARSDSAPHELPQRQGVLPGAFRLLLRL